MSVTNVSIAMPPDLGFGVRAGDRRLVLFAFDNGGENVQDKLLAGLEFLLAEVQSALETNGE